MRFEDRGELSTAVICLFDLNATAETAEGTEGGGSGNVCRDAAKGHSTSEERAMSFGNAPNEGTTGKGASKNGSEEKSCVAHGQGWTIHKCYTIWET